MLLAGEKLHIFLLMSHVSRLTCRMSHDTFHVSQFMCHMSLFSSFFALDKEVKLIGRGLLSTGLPLLVLKPAQEVSN